MGHHGYRSGGSWRYRVIKQYKRRAEKFLSESESFEQREAWRNTIQWLNDILSTKRLNSKGSISIPPINLQDFPKRKRFRIKIGTKKIADKEFTVAEILNWLSHFGFQSKSIACSLSGFQRFCVDAGYLKNESLHSLAGHKYGQIATLEIYACEREPIEIVLRGVNAEILDDV